VRFRILAKITEFGEVRSRKGLFLQKIELKQGVLWGLEVGENGQG